MLGQKAFPIVENSVQCVDVIVVPPGMQSRVLVQDALTCLDDHEDVISLSQKRKLVEAHMLRTTCSLPCPDLIIDGKLQPCNWNMSSVAKFIGNFHLSKSKNEIKTYVMGEYRVANMRNKSLCRRSHTLRQTTPMSKQLTAPCLCTYHLSVKVSYTSSQRTTERQLKPPLR